MRKYFFNYIQRFVAHEMYPYLVAFVGFLDMFFLIVPNDLLLVAGVLAAPKRWYKSAFIVTIGSTLGAWALAFALLAGKSVILKVPVLEHSHWWLDARIYFQHYGAWALFLGAAVPIPVQPFIAAAIFSNFQAAQIAFFVCMGRLVKYFSLGLIASRFPKLLVYLKI